METEGRSPALSAPAPTTAGATLLPTADVEAVELFFELDTPAERDIFLRHFAGRRSPEAAAFLLAAMRGDQDPFVRVGAARALAAQGAAEAIEYLREQLAIAFDDDLLFEVTAAWVAALGPAGWPELAAVFADADRSTKERLVAQAALAGLDEGRTVEKLVLALEEQRGARYDVDLLRGIVGGIAAAEGHLPLRARAERALTSELAEADRQVRAAEQATALWAPDDDAYDRALDEVDTWTERALALRECLLALALAPPDTASL